jgi:hypothetical protein
MCCDILLVIFVVSTPVIVKNTQFHACYREKMKTVDKC